MSLLRSNFLNNLEAEGAAFAVYKDAQLVADLYGGYADKDADRLWREDTMTVSFSATKVGLFSKVQELL